MLDVLIIGSGFGGAIPAYELARAGLKVCLLERGPWRDTPPARAAGIDRLAPLPQGRHFFTHVACRLHHRWLPRGGLNLHRHGLLEVFAGSGANVVCASGVGGGSHAYGGLHAYPLCEDYWDGVAEGISSTAMAPHYTAVKTLLGSRPPEVAQEGMAWQQGTNDFVEVQGAQAPDWGYALGTDFSREGSFGSPQGHKVTLDAACLIPAWRCGLEIKDCHEALQVCRLPEGGFEVAAKNHYNGRTCTLRARRLIVAAGALNTLSLLLRSRANGTLAGMPALGHGFGTNADVMAFWPVNTPDANHPADGVYQNLFRHYEDTHGPVFMQAGISGLQALPLPVFIRRFLQRQLFIAGMGIDAADGQISLEQGRLRISYDVTNSPVFQRIADHLEKIGIVSGQRLYAPSKPSTVHPLGGARTGQSIATSVVNGHGEVHDIPGLFITDASVLPAALGSPPSLTIAAWARHVALGMIRTV